MSRKRTTTYIFEQQLHAEYWDWEEDKKALLTNWESNKTISFIPKNWFQNQSY